MTNGVVYQIYPRSFQDSDGDGVGDLAGIRVAARPPRVARAWTRSGCRRSTRRRWPTSATTSPTTRTSTRSSATSRDFDALVEAAHARGLSVLLDIVPCHTSIEHPWFREHPDWYIWARRARTTGCRPSAARRGRRSASRYYLHSFYPEQPDLDWRNPEVVAAMQDVLRFWLERGVDGYRIDAIDRLLKDPRAARRPARHRAVRPAADARRRRKLALTYSRNAPDTGEALATIREACGRRASWSARSTCRAARWQPYLEHFDAVFAFELLHAPWEAERAARGDRGHHARSPGAAWVHVEPRLRPPGHALRRARTRAPRRCCC